MEKKKLIFVCKYLIFIAICVIGVPTNAQDNLKARIEFENAESSFVAGAYPAAVSALEKTESLLGRWTTKVSYLKIEALQKLADLSDFKNLNTQKLATEVEKYMLYATENPDDVILEKYKVVYQLDESLKTVKTIDNEQQSPGYKAGQEAYDRKNYTKAFEYFLQDAENGNVSAMEKVGYLYFIGAVIPRDVRDKEFKKAMEWYLKAANKGNAAAMYKIADLYSWGLGVTEDYSKAMEWYLKAAEKGNDQAMYQIGFSYDIGQGVAQDEKRAMEWYLKAADKGNPDAMYYIGRSYFHTSDYSTAMEWYLKAADKGFSLAMREIGRMYNHGWGVAQNYSKAMEWYLKAAEKGNTEVMNSIAKFYYEGTGVTKDNSKALEWWLKAAEEGNNQAMYSIGWYYDYVNEDYSKAMEWYLKAADKKNKNALTGISRLYEKGLGVKKNKTTAVEWYNKAQQTN